MAPPTKYNHDDPSLIPSDSEDDDFTLAQGTDHDESDSDSSDEERPAKKQKVAEPEEAP